MKFWHWFCRLGTDAPVQQTVFPKARKQKDTVTGTEICTRVCGHKSCRCGGTMRGMYCIWSYYRE